MKPFKREPFSDRVKNALEKRNAYFAEEARNVRANISVATASARHRQAAQLCTVGTYAARPET
jgi:FixJ family two-component response regulator